MTRPTASPRYKALARRYAHGKVVTCPRCRGYGKLYNTDGSQILCPVCNGKGVVDA